MNRNAKIEVTSAVPSSRPARQNFRGQSYLQKSLVNVVAQFLALWGYAVQVAVSSIKTTRLAHFRGIEHVMFKAHATKEAEENSAAYYLALAPWS